MGAAPAAAAASGDLDITTTNTFGIADNTFTYGQTTWLPVAGTMGL